MIYLQGISRIILLYGQLKFKKQHGDDIERPARLVLP